MTNSDGLHGVQPDGRTYFDDVSARKQLLLDVSHELRSPITRMKVALEMMPGDALRKNLEEDLLMLESMVTEILETSRLESQNGS